MRVLLDTGPYNVPSHFRQTLRDACREACAHAEIIETTAEKPLDHFEGSHIDVLACEALPKDLSKWPSLRYVQLWSAGMNHLHGHPIWETDIPVASASGTHSVPIAQYVTCAVLMMAHHMPRLIELTTSRKWRPQGLEGSVVRGQTAGILGYGSIGRECARQLSTGLGMRIVCIKRNPEHRRDDGFTAWTGTGDPDGAIPEAWFGPAQLHEMLARCDVLVITTPATRETLGLIGARELRMLKPTARLINVARGGIVDESALASALREGRLAGAAMDCFAKEPLPHDSVLFDAPNLILTPHMSGVHIGFWPAMAALLGENLRRHSSGLPVLNRVNGRAGY
jgi:phosphoglycerate dehydrogenase-like enzyme